MEENYLPESERYDAAGLWQAMEPLPLAPLNAFELPLAPLDPGKVASIVASLSRVSMPEFELKPMRDPGTDPLGISARLRQEYADSLERLAAMLTHASGLLEHHAMRVSSDGRSSRINTPSLVSVKEAFRGCRSPGSMM